MFLPEASFYQQITNTLIPVDCAIDCLLPKMAHLSKANPPGDYVCLGWLTGTILFTLQMKSTVVTQTVGCDLSAVGGCTHKDTRIHLRTKLFRTFKN